MTSPSRPTIAIVGAGIAGLAAAWELVSASGAAGRAAPEVHLIETGDRVGGKLRSAVFAGRRVDLAADAFLGRRPEAIELCDELGLTEDLVPVGATGASIWARGQLRQMPAGLNLGVPTRWWPLLRSGILSPGESMRVARDLVAPHRGTEGRTDDRAVGAIVGERLGRPVVDRLVDPLVGGINAGGVDDLSAAATFPPLLAASYRSGSLMRRLRPANGAAEPAPAEPSPVFWSLPESTASLADALAEALVRRGATIHTHLSVRAMDRRHPGQTGASWQLALEHRSGAPRESGDRSDGPEVLQADGVVLAVPAPAAAVLLAPHAPEAAGILGSIGYASVAVVTLSLPTGAIRTPLLGTGFLVPRTSTIAGGPALITGCTYLGRKWPHLARPGDELIRVSVGRFGDSRQDDLGDDELTASVFGELAHLLDIRGAPLHSLVTRWDRGFPQFQVGHLDRVDRLDRSLAVLDGVAVAGAAYRGVGIPACIGSGRAAARRVLGSVSTGSAPAGARSAPPELGR